LKEISIGTLLSVTMIAACAQELPTSTDRKAPSPTASAPVPGITPPDPRILLHRPRIGEKKKTSDKVIVPMSKEAQARCNEYFEKHKKELSACEV